MTRVQGKAVKRKVASVKGTKRREKLRRGESKLDKLRFFYEQVLSEVGEELLLMANLKTAEEVLQELIQQDELDDEE